MTTTPDYPEGHKQGIDAANKKLIAAARTILAISTEHVDDPADARYKVSDGDVTVIVLNKQTKDPADQLLEIGQEMAKGTMVLHQEVGGCTSPAGPEYEILMTLPHCAPYFKNKETGKSVSFSWQDLFRLALLCGLDQRTAD